MMLADPADAIARGTNPLRWELSLYHENLQFYCLSETETPPLVPLAYANSNLIDGACPFHRAYLLPECVRHVRIPAEVGPLRGLLSREHGRELYPLPPVHENVGARQG
jgi:hypothetical protein